MAAPPNAHGLQNCYASIYRYRWKASFPIAQDKIMEGIRLLAIEKMPSALKPSVAPMQLRLLWNREASIGSLLTKYWKRMVFMWCWSMPEIPVRRQDAKPTRMTRSGNNDSTPVGCGSDLFKLFERLFLVDLD